MIEHLPFWISILFLGAFFATLGLFHYSNGKPKTVSLIIILWSIAHSVLAYIGFYKVTQTYPPRFALVLLPVIAIIIFSLFPQNLNKIKLHRNTGISTFLHTIRIPVEIVLLQLFIYKMVPQLMTFEGSNFDILMGITAPMIGTLLYKNKIGSIGLLLWNAIGLILILSILFFGLLSAELPFQQFGFDQPNQAVTYFPFILLPATIVPIVIWTHLTDIAILISKIKGKASS